MKRIVSLMMVAGLVAGGLAALAVAADAQATAKHRAAVVAIGEVPAPLVQHACEWARHNLALMIDLLPAQPFTGKTLDDAAASAVKVAPTGCAHVVAIALPPEGIDNHGMRMADGRAAVVNLRPMKAGQPKEGILERRIERQTIRALSLMLDLETCVNPQCALVKYSTLEELDHSGRNLCPPCLTKFQTKAQAAHLELDKDSPYLINQ